MKARTISWNHAIAEKENKEQAISHKEENGKLTAYFKEILADYDEERVSFRHKKILNWYNMLQAKG
jgi:glycerol-3-phosphate O-acyltransferase